MLTWRYRALSLCKFSWNSCFSTSPQLQQLQKKLLSLGLYMFLVPIYKNWGNCGEVFSPLSWFKAGGGAYPGCSGFLPFPRPGVSWRVGSRKPFLWEMEGKGWPLPFCEGGIVRFFPLWFLYNHATSEQKRMPKLSLSALRRVSCSGYVWLFHPGEANVKEAAGLQGLP